MLPLAVPGLVLAFGYVAMSRGWTDGQGWAAGGLIGGGRTRFRSW